MKPKIKSGQLVTVTPTILRDLEPGDIVFCRVKGTNYVHLVKKVGRKGALISNAKGRENGWTKTVYGKVTEVED